MTAGAEISRMFGLAERSILITGGTGVLGRELVAGLASCGARMAVVARDPARADALAARVKSAGGEIMVLKADVMDRRAFLGAAEEVTKTWGGIDCLINGAGGNDPKATAMPGGTSFFDLPEDALRFVLDLNVMGTIIPSQVVGRLMAGRKQGVILNISSMNAFRPLTRIAAYSAAKAAVSNFTAWLAVHMAQEYSPDIRVNAIAPGFFLTEQNRFLLTEKDSGALSARGRKIIEHTPMARFGEPQDLLGAVVWLLSPAARFVTGIVVPVDGGFSAYSGV